MNNDIKVSVICTAYNHEKYIKDALESFVKQQTNFKFEVLVSDDASTDATAQIIREYELKYPDIIKPIYLKENLFQKGIEKMQECFLPVARGKYIAFCEGDDYWCDVHKLQRQYDILEDNDNISMCVNSVQCVKSDKTPTDEIYPPKYACLEKDELLSADKFASLVMQSYVFQTSSYFLRTDDVKRHIDYIVKNQNNGDQKYLRIAALSGDIYFIKDIMSCKRMFTEGSWSSGISEAKKNYIDYCLTAIRAEREFDKYSNYRFHKYGFKSLSSQYIFVYSFYKTEELKKEVKDYLVNFYDGSRLSLKEKIKIHLFKLSPAICTNILILVKSLFKLEESAND